MEWPKKLIELQEEFFHKAYKNYLSQINSSYPEFGFQIEKYIFPEFDVEKKREDWVEMFARWTHKQNVSLSNNLCSLPDVIDKSLKKFIYYPQGQKTALFMTLEEIRIPEESFCQEVCKVVWDTENLELPSRWPNDHTLNVAKYVSDLFPEELQIFSQENSAQLILHNSEFADAFAFARKQGFSRAFAFKGDRGEVRGRVFIAVSETRPRSYQFVGYQVRGKDSKKFYTEALGPFFHNGGVFVRHQRPTPISKFKSTINKDLICADDLVVIGYQNALWRQLDGPSLGTGTEWRRDFLTTDGIEIDLFLNIKTGKKIFSVRNMYGEEILEMLDLLWDKGCRRYVYLGSAGALDAEIKVGDLVMPTDFICKNSESFHFKNGASALPIHLTDSLRVWSHTRHGTVATLIEETIQKMQSMAGLGIQAVDIEAQYFAKFFHDRQIEASIILAVTDLPLGEIKMDQGYETNFAAVKSMCRIFPELIKS
jgi:hypothetical protein